MGRTQVGTFYMVFMDENVGREAYSVPDLAFSSKEDALRSAAKKTNLRSLLLNSCQVTTICGSRLISGKSQTLEARTL